MAYHLRFDKGNLAMQVAVLFAVLFGCLPVSRAQEYKVVYKEIPDNRGREFVVGFLQQFKQELDGATRLFITSDYNTRAVISSRHTNVRKEIQIKSRELYPIDFPTSIRMQGTKPENKGIYIKADTEIVVYGLNIKKFTTDAYLALPVDIQSTKYIVPSFTPSYKSLIGIIAIHDRTTIFVTFRFADRRSVYTFRGRGYRHKDTLSITLSRHQTFQIAHTKDMTGTRIFSTRPISVLSGNECANVPTEKGYCDHLVEHIPPVNTWGQRFITAPLAGRQGGDFFRIMAANQSTDVRINGKYIQTLDEGKFVEVDVPSDRYQFIETSKPCIVLQYSKGQRVDDTLTDPFMVMIPPVEQYTAQYTVSTPDQNEKYFDSYINIIIDTKEIDGLRLDGRSLRDEKWVPVWGTTHSATRMAVSHGVHRVMHDSPIVPFAIFLYGYARADSYGYPGGLRLADLTLQCVPGKPGDGLDNDCDRRIDEEIKNFIDDDNDGRIDEDLVTEPPEIILDLDALILTGCPDAVKKQIPEPRVLSAPLCNSRGPIKLSYVDNVQERECVQYIERMWLVRDGCGNLANTTQEIRIRRPEMSVTFPGNVREKCHVGEDLSEVGEPRVRMSCREDQFSMKYRDTPTLIECISRGRTIAREWTVKASCGSVVKHTQKLLPDATPPKISFVGKLPNHVKTNFRISWNASEQSTFECSLDGPNEVFPCGSGWGESWSRRDIPNGKHQFWVRAIDLAGNTGAFIKHLFQVDTNGPRLAFAQPLTSLSRGPIAIKWVSNEMARFKCGLNPDRMEQCGSGTSGKEYKRDLQDGSYNFSVGAVDALGNEATMIWHSFRIDSTPPRIKFGKSLYPTLNTRVDLPLLSNELTSFNCSLDDQPYTACGKGLKGRFTARDLTEGPHELKVKGTDEAGNEADPISLKWNSDRTSPNILFTPGLPTKFRQRARLTWTSTEYARFECSLNDRTQFRPCGQGSLGRWTNSRIPEGDHEFYVRGTDRNSNVGPIASFAFTIDNTFPVISLNEPLPTTSTSQTATFRWTSNEMANYKCAVDDTSKFVNCGSGLNGGWTTPTLENGDHTFYLTAKDEVGNRAPRLSHSWSIDNTPPVLTFSGSLPDNVNTNIQKFSWTSTEYAKFKCYIDSESQPFSCGTGNRGSWTSSELLDGQHTFRVFGTDRYGNQGPVIQHTWNIDTRAPTVNLAKIPATMNKSQATFNWKSNEPATFLCALDDDDGTSCGQGTDGEYLTPTLADGEHEFRLLVEDMVGNLAPLIRSKFDIDTSLPVITFDKSNPTTPETGLSVTWRSSEDAVFECALENPNQYEPCGRGTTGSFQRNDLPDGRHSLYVRGIDDVGNVGLPSVYTVTTDRTPPSVRFTSQPNPASNNPTETFTWDSDEPATFICKVDEGEERECGQGTNGRFTATNLPDGDHVFQVTPVDEAGNRGRMLERTWNKDTTAPEISYTSHPPKVSKDSVIFRWSSEAASFECALDDITRATPCGSGTTGQKRLDNLPIGTRVFYVRGTDIAGNVGQFAAHQWSVDTNPPDIEFTGDLPSFSKKRITFTYKANEDSEFECRLDNNPNFYPCGNGIRGNTTLSDLPEGNHTFYVRARDRLDNVVRPISHSWVVDSIPPRAVLDPVDPIVGTPRVRLYWRSNEKSKFLCAIGDVGNIIECGQGTRGSWTTPYLRRGPQKFWLIAEDYTGNRAEPVSVTWTVDNQAPVVTFSEDSTSKSTNSSPRFSWTSDEFARFECAIEGVSTFKNCGSGTSGTWTGTNVPDGKRTFLVRARDLYENQNDPYSFPFEIDTTPPSGFATSVPSRRTKNPRANFRWKTSEDARYKCYLDNEISPTDCGEGRNGQFTTNSLPDGDHNFTVVATDELGNSAPVVNAKWTVDTSGPVLSFAPNLPKHSLGSPRFNWTSDETAEQFLCALDDQSNWVDCGFGNTGAWQRYNVPDGKHELFVRGKDDLGNTGLTIRHPFVVDHTAPRISITTAPDPSSSSPTIEWRSTEPVDFKCSLDGRAVDCGEGTTGSWTGSNVPDGLRKFVIEGVDKLGNTGRFTYTWTKDSTVPSVTFDSNQPTVTLRTPRFTWTSSEPANFECSLDGFRTLEQCGSGTTGAWQRYKLDGDYTLSVRGKDNNGNIGVPATHSFRVDNTAPTILIRSTTDLKTATPTIKWTSSENVDFKCSVDDGQLFDCGSGTTGSWTGSNLVDGPHRFVIEGRDAVLNTGRHTFTWNKDSTLPQITFDANQPTVTLRFPRFSWTSSKYAIFKCSFDGFVLDIQPCGSGTSGSWQGFQQDGNYTLSVRGQDNNGDTGSPVSHKFRVDNTPPTIKIVAKPRLNSSSPSIEWTSSEDVRFQCSWDYRPSFDCGRGTTGLWTGNNLPEGRHTFVIDGVDEMGNTGKHTFRWTQDSIAPEIQFKQLPDQADSSPRFSWTSNEPAIFECSLDGEKYENCGSGYDGQWQKSRIPGGEHTFSVRATDAYENVGQPITHTWNVDVRGPVVTIRDASIRRNRALFSWSSNKPARFYCAIDNQNSLQYCGAGTIGSQPYYNLQDGKHTFYVRGEDARGNRGNLASRQFSVDNSPPVVTITSDDSPYSTRNPSFTFESSEESTFLCAIDSTRFYQPCGRGLRSQFTASNVLDGQHAFFVQGTDLSGNVGNHERYIFTVDTTGPQAYLTSRTPRTTKTPRVRLTWLANEHSLFNCTVDGKTVTCGSGTQGDFTTDALPDGQHTFRLDLVDRLGNKGEPVTVSWETDSSSPVIQFSPDLPQRTSTTPKISWTSSEFAYFQCNLDGVQTISCGQGETGDMSFPLSEGPHRFSVRGTDRYGNAGEWERYQFVVDASGPDITFPSNLSKVTNRQPTFRWNSSENANFKCGIDNSFNLVDCGQGSNGQWTGQNIPDGRHVFIVIGRDDLGNWGPYAQHRFTVDNTVPVISFVTSNDPTNTQPQIRWTSSEDATFECSLDGQNYQKCGNGFSGFWTGDNIPDGRHTFSVRGRDKNGNVGDPADFEWSVDNQRPLLSITSNTPSKSNNPRQKITWSSSEPATFQCRLDDRIVPCGTGTKTNGEYTTSLLPDGRHTFEVVAVDSVGNKGTPKVVEWSTDSQAPIVSLNSRNRPRTSNSRYTVTWDTNEQADFECTLNGRIVECGSGTRGEYTTSSLPDGKHIFQVSAVDNFGNRGTPRVVTWFTDTQAPNVSFTNNTPRKSNNPSQRITWDSSEPATFECTLNGLNVNCGRGTSGLYTTPNLPDGDHTFTVNAVDDLGNKGTPKVVSWSTDTRGPTLTYASSNSPNTNQRQVIRWTSNEQASFKCTLDGVTTDCGSGRTGEYTSSNLPDGRHTFEVYGVDDLGNQGTPQTVSWSKDTQAPVVSFTSNIPRKTNNPSQRITWDSSEPATFECTLNGLNVNCGGRTSGLYTTPNLPDGNHTFTANAVDDLGNKGTPKVISWSTDTRGPTLTYTSSNSPNTNQRQIIRWTSNEQASFKCTLDGVTTDCGSGRTGEYTSSNLPDGRHTFEVYGVDDLGNQGTPQTVSWSKDTQAPVVSFTSNIPRKTNNPSQRITWDSSEPATFECTLNGLNVNCGGRTSGLYTTPNLPDGNHTFTANAVDDLGNKGTPKVISWSTDTRGPTLTYTSSNSPNTNQRQIIRWTSNEQASFKCTLDGVTTDCGSGRTGEYTSSNLPDGRHTFEVYGVDDLGNQGTPQTVSWSKDTQAPVLTFTSNTPRQTNNPSQRITWDSSEPATFECTLNGLNVDCSRGTSGLYITPNLPDGNHTFTVNAVDDLGNKGTPKVVSWSTDKRGPGLTITSINPPKTNQRQIIRWSSTEPASFKCKMDGVSTDCGKGRTGEFTSSNLPDGRHTFEVYAVDDLGNRGTPQVVGWSTDTRGPIVRITNRILPKTKNPKTRITWSSDEQGTFECILDGTVKVPCGNGSIGDYTTPDLGDGKHSFSISSVDPLGNKGRPVRVEWETDSSAPDITFSSTLPLTTRGSPFVSWTSSESSAFECALDDKTRIIRCGRGTSGDWNGLSIPHGPHTFWVRGTDSFRNVGEWEPYNFEVDSKGPNITFGDQATNTQNSPTFRWSSSEPAQFKCRMRNSFNEVDCGNGMKGTWTGNQIPDGPHTFIVYGVDKMNNIGPIAELRFKVDATGPRISFPADIPAITKTNPYFTWTSSEPASFKCAVHVEGSQPNYVDCGQGTSGNWTRPNIPDGAYKFLVYGTDDMNNRGPTKEHRFIVDATGPKISFEDNQPTLTKSNPSFNWTSSEKATFKCALDNGQRNFVDCGYGTNGKWVGVNIPDGPSKLLVYGIDDNNNRGPIAEYNFIVDTRPPRITFSGDLPETTSRNPTLTWSSSEYSSFECKLEDGVIFECGSGEEGSWTGSNLNDGSHSLSIRGTDSLGNRGQFISRSWTVDESGPRLRFDGVIPTRARRLPRIRWISNEFAFFECSLNGHNYTRCGTGLWGSWWKDETPTGLQEFRVRGRDTKGNVGEPIFVSIDIDTTAPQIELLRPLPVKTDQPTWEFTWTSDELANFTCAVDRLSTEVDCGFGLNGRFTTQPLSDGPHRFYLFGKDELGNPAKVIIHRWTVNKEKPEIEFLPNQPTVSDADITLLWKTTSHKSAQFECALDNVRDMQPCGEGVTGSWTGTDIPNGDHTLYVRAKDSFGDYGQIKTHNWRVDTKVPEVNLIGAPQQFSRNETGLFYWTSDEDASYECAIDLAESGTPCGRGTSVRWNSPRLEDGEHTFYLFATDSNGNQAQPIEYKWTIDTTPPVVTLDENSERVSGNNATIRWRTNEYAIFQCAVDSIFANRDCGSGTDSEIVLSDLEDGPHTVWIKAVDALGNIAPWKKHTWTVDSKPPELDFTSELPTKTNSDVSFFWRSQEPTKFKCGTNANDLKNCGSGVVGNWSANNLTDGVHQFFVEATDEFGNTIRILHRWTVDNIPPMLYWRRRVPDVTGKRVRFKWLSDETAEFFCAHEEIEDMQKCGNFSMRGRWIEENLPEGRHRFWVVGVDAVGNRGIPLYHTWIVDTRGPVLFFDQPVPKKSGRSVRFSWRSNEFARFKCAFDSRTNFSDCGQGRQARITSDNLKRNGEHVLYVKGIDDQGNVGETIVAKWIVDLVAPVLVESGVLPRLTNRNPVITWTVNEEAVFECALDDRNKFKGCGNGTDGEWRGKNLNNGPHTIVVRARDPQGNTNNLIDHKFVVGIPDNRGREFMLGFMQQYLHKQAGSVSLFITSDNNTLANITIPGGFIKRLQLQTDELVRVDLPISVRMSGSQKEKKGILVAAEHELVVYGLNIMPHSTDAFLALPTDIQGTEYYAVSYTVSQHSLIGIVGIYDNTLVYITLRMGKDTPLIFNGAVYRNGETMILKIDRQETLQLTHTEDLTGTRIASTQVISVYSGNECANVPKEKGYCDHLVEMLTPTSTWGRRFVTAPLFSRRAGDFFRVVASQDNTVVTFHPNDWNLLSAGQHMERDVPSDEYKFITASKPCILMQYSKGADSDNTNTDPFLIMIPPIEQYGSHYILSTPDRPEQQYFQSYINVIVLSEHYKGILVDGNPAYLYSPFKQIPGTPYSASAVRVTKGVHRVDHTSPIITFGAFMYGYAWRDSYGYPGGLRLADITGECTGVDTPADGMDNDCDRRIDEELKNGIDDDGDGRIDEDLATFPPTIELDNPYYEYESCAFEVDALVPRPKAISSADCDYKGTLRLTYRDKIREEDCTQTINRTWQASDGCGNVVYLNQIIKITRPPLFVRFPPHVPNGCVGAISLRVTGRPQVESPCKQERVRVAYRDNISKKDCQEKGLLLERHFTVTEVCGREYTGVQRIYPGART